MFSTNHLKNREMSQDKDVVASFELHFLGFLEENTVQRSSQSCCTHGYLSQPSCELSTIVSKCLDAHKLSISTSTSVLSSIGRTSTHTCLVQGERKLELGGNNGATFLEL